MAHEAAAALAREGEGFIQAGSLVDGFRVLKPVAEGAMGEVFLAQDLVLGRRVALKFLKVELLGAENTERLLEEARTTARFNHPHIVTVHAVGRHHGRPYLALEYVDGESLRQRLAGERLSIHEALRICRAIAEAIAEAHRHEIIHADLKPENVLLPRDGRVRVVDFGLARHAGAEQAAASGTPAYMAPERWRGAPPSPAIDLWSLGIIAYELLEGRRPLDDMQLARWAFAPKPLPASPRLREVPAAQVLQACLALEPTERPSAQDVAQALGEALSSGASSRTGDRVPFRGLRAFTEADAEDFAGREAEIDAFIERLRHEPLVPLVGPSGIGKSSFLHAGVFARLRQMERWTILHARPGPRPMERLASVLLAGLSGEGTPEELADVLVKRPGEIVRLLRQRCTSTGGRVLLALDAFEEVFTLSTPEEAHRISACLAAAASADDRWRVVIVLRDDYLGQYSRLEPLRPHLGATFVLPRLTAAALQEAITAPLRRVGYSVDDPSLMTRLVADVQAQPAGLPLLQFACMALWERRDVETRRLLTSVYEELGGVGGALASHAQQLLMHLPAEEVRVARSMLLRLVTPSGTRQPRAQAALLEGLGAAGPSILEKLLSNRLVVVTRDPQTDEAFVELAHESLAASWPDLARWLDETREERTLVQQLEQATQLWEQRGRQDEETWSDEALRQALHKVEEWNVTLPTRTRAFLEAGRERARRLTLRRRQVLGGSISVLAVIALAAVLAAVAFREKQLEAIRQQDQIRLASADIGEFELVLEAYDFDPASQQWTKASPGPTLDWSLLPAQGATPPEALSPYEEPNLRRSERRHEPDGSWRERVEAPSRPAWLVVRRGDCPPSAVRLQKLPGYLERGRHPLQELRIPVPTCAASRVGMVAVPQGPYWRPVELDYDGRIVAPETQVDVGGFAIDLTEVTTGQFRLFEEHVMPQTGDERSLPPENAFYEQFLKPSSPVTGVDAFAAEAFCRFMGKALPTQDEWRKAFRGGLSLDEEGRLPNPAPRRMTVWHEPRPKPPTNLATGDAYEAIAPVGSFPEDRSPYGVLDLAGNVTEWTATTDLKGAYKNQRILGGGRWDSPVELGQHEITWVNHLQPNRADLATGLRCAARTAPDKPSR
jgi:formylglycine-generating enzyme required for sulfatase activity/tRNA A-37 threonylcarbamoyl transferase component Bud32